MSHWPCHTMQDARLHHTLRFSLISDFYICCYDLCTALGLTEPVYTLFLCVHKRTPFPLSVRLLSLVSSAICPEIPLCSIYLLPSCTLSRGAIMTTHTLLPNLLRFVEAPTTANRSAARKVRTSEFMQHVARDATAVDGGGLRDTFFFLHGHAIINRTKI